MKAVIRSVGAFLPEKRMANDEFAKFLDTSDEWIVSHTGIKYRHIADEKHASSDLGVFAAQKALERAGLTPTDIDLIIVATATPDHPGFPATACLVQEKLGAINAGAFDISAACSGFITGLETARNFIVGGSVKNILLIAAEVFSRAMNWKDRNTCVLFGDGAGAVVINGETEESRGIETSILKADGTGSKYLKIPVGGSRNPFWKVKNPR